MSLSRFLYKKKHQHFIVPLNHGRVKTGVQRSHLHGSRKKKVCVKREKETRKTPSQTQPLGVGAGGGSAAAFRREALSKSHQISAAKPKRSFAQPRRGQTNGFNTRLHMPRERRLQLRRLYNAEAPRALKVFFLLLSPSAISNPFPFLRTRLFYVRLISFRLEIAV